ncbi:hypothetical protein IQ268_15740 [Oculatella sp. LEGE 06141]|uniref:hypothetical protein n=1 Tax=Oculatella sp. LEGE 06141 TaxID=1828648 RepID=UPI001881EAAD|nr:hypothetical protein [Oculatella sp. LEGE 06141]MBE9180022.1 hypothetical protein [Oculatella sp. LEGE 06141]
MRCIRPLNPPGLEDFRADSVSKSLELLGLSTCGKPEETAKRPLTPTVVTRYLSAIAQFRPFKFFE